ncbi:MAG: hypothetical protein ACLVAT_09195 [Lachnospiraceae bacterium]
MHFSYEDEVVVEESIEGREFSVGVVDGKAYPIIEIAPVEGFYDYKNKYSWHDHRPPVLQFDLRTDRRCEHLQKQDAKALAVEDMHRLDFPMKEDGSMYRLRANTTLPGMTPTSLLPQEAAVLGIDYAQLCGKAD